MVFLIIISLLLLLAVVAGLALGNHRYDRWITNVSSQAPFLFPSNFFWGSAVASQQIESQMKTDWTAFEKDAVKGGKTKHGPTVSEGLPGHIIDLDMMPAHARKHKAGFSKKYKEDIKAIRNQKHNAFRFSLEWARLYPNKSTKNPSKAAVDYYKNIFKELKKNKVTPFVSLFHFSSPEWFWESVDGKHGWERPDAQEHWARYVDFVIKNFYSYVDNWCTINEPMVYLVQGYLNGLFPPLEQRKNPVEIEPAVVALLKAHTYAYHAIHDFYKKKNKGVMVGIAKHTRVFAPLRNWHPIDRISAKKTEEAFIWDFLDALQNGYIKFTVSGNEVHIDGLQGTQDYVGINYYGRFYLQSRLRSLTDPIVHNADLNDPNEKTSDLGWCIYPHGLYQILDAVNRRYQKPIFILENGIADDTPGTDLKRQQFLVTHLKEIHNAIRFANVDVRGYMHWSLMDNFEWAEGFGPRFGLWEVDYKKSLKRIPRESAKLYTSIIESGGIDGPTWDRFKEK